VGAVCPGAEVVGVEDDLWGGHCVCWGSGCGSKDGLEQGRTEEGLYGVARTWISKLRPLQSSGANDDIWGARLSD
jgi:hypothetical protein